MYRIQRERMVEKQLRARGISDKRVLNVFLKLERHLFIEESLWDRAYEDTPLPIGKNQTISQPYIVALMSEALELKGSERILEIGTGSGYQAAILALLSGQVFTVERHTELTRKAREIFDLLNLHNIATRMGDGSIGWSKFAPYDRIVVTAASPKRPQPLLDQLTDGGMLVIPIGEEDTQMLYKFTKKGTTVERESLCPCAFVPLIGVEGWKS
ncbi:protein-L-isoaspartate(D-aspartate) O-methyltransferase [candidate division KSB1 bacterium]